ncbi:putative transposase, Ptta/En/Spm, plant [Dioscorea sansibarensis]
MFNKKASEWLRRNLGRAQEKRKRPEWIRHNVWEQLLLIWNYEKYRKYYGKNKRRHQSNAKGSTTIYHGGSISMIEHRDRLEAKLGKKVSMVEAFIAIYEKEDGSLNVQRAQFAHEKFLMAYQHILDREGQRVLIDDDKLWRNLFWVAKNGCYDMGNLIEEITTSEYSHCQSQRSTSTIQQSVASIPPEDMSNRSNIANFQRRHTRSKSSGTNTFFLS